MGKTLRLGRITDQSITTALLHLRAKIIRENLGGLEHVDALLQLQGSDPGEWHIQSKTDRRFRRGKLRIAILAALRDGPLTGREIAELVCSRHGEMAFSEAYRRVYTCLGTMRRAGMVAHEGRFWGLLGP